MTADRPGHRGTQGPTEGKPSDSLSVEFGDREILDHLHEVVFETDSRGNWTYLNRAWTEITGFSVEQTLGTNFVDYLHPEEVETTLALVQQVVLGQSPHCHHEGRYLTSDGGYRWIELRASPIRDSAGLVVGNAGTMFDITERHEAEEALRRAEAEYRTLVEHVPAVVYTAGFGPIAPWTYVSPQIEAMLGYSVEEWTSAPMRYERLHPEDRDRVIREERQDLFGDGGVPAKSEYRLLTKDERVVWVHDEGFIVRDEDGEPLFYQGVLFDISERKALEEHLENLLAITEKVLREREDDRKRIAGYIHDTSLQMLAAATYASSNANRFLETGNLRGAAEAIHSTQIAVERAMTALRESAIELARSSTPEGALIDSIRAFLEHISVLWGAQVRLEGTVEHEPPVPVALAALQIAQEGVINAVKHSQGKAVTVTVGEETERLQVLIEDDGLGFTPEKVRGEERMGLRLMRERADRVGGQIHIDSKPGGGTRVKAVLPC